MDEGSDNFPVQCHTSGIGSFICGACGTTLDSICILHTHMTAQHSDGSYHYDNLIKTAFPKYDSFCAGTQISKMDKTYLRRYRRSRTGKPPKRVNKIKVESEVRDNMILLKSNNNVEKDIIPLIKQDNLCKKDVQKQTNNSRRYTFRESTNINRQQLQKCNVALERLEFGEECVKIKKDKRKYKHTVIDVIGNTDNSSKLFANSYPYNKDKLEGNKSGNDIGASRTSNTYNVGDDIYEDHDDSWEDVHGVPDETLHVTEISVSHAHVGPFSGNAIPADQQPINQPNTENHGITANADTSSKKDYVAATVAKRKYTRRKKTFDDLDLVSSLVDTKRKRTQLMDSLCEVEIETEQDTHKEHSTYSLTTIGKTKRDKRAKTKLTKSKLSANSTLTSTGKKIYKYTFICHLCGKERPERTKELHMNNHLGLRPYICDECGKSFAAKRHLQSHQRFHAKDKGIGQFICAECGQVFVTKNNYNSHVNNHTGSKPCKCQYCDAAFTIEKHLKDHVRRVHERIKKVKCDGCEKMYFNRSAMMNHFKVHHAEPSLPCKYCGKMFRTNRVRHNHELTHTGQKEFSCFVCHHGFIQWWPYLMHMMKQHGFSKEQVVDMKMKLKQIQTKETTLATGNALDLIYANPIPIPNVVEQSCVDYSITGRENCALFHNDCTEDPKTTPV